MTTSDTTAEANLDADYGSGAPATIYACLTTTAPVMTGAGTIVEPTSGQYTGYAEVAITNDASHWPATAANIKHNGITFSFPVAQAGSTDNTPLTHLVFRSALNGGRIIDALLLPAGTVVTTGQGLSFPPNSVQITER